MHTLSKSVKLFLMINSTRKRIVNGKIRHTRLYSIWANMRHRCQCKTNSSYKYYGGRGISVCEEWSDFDVFRPWALSHGYESHLTIDRIDNDGNYKPSNCRWATRYEQGQNNRRAKWYEFNGLNKTITQWSVYCGITDSTMSWRLRNWDRKKALTTKNTRFL